MKPKVAFESQKKARSNLFRKLTHIRSSVENGDDLIDFPVSLRQFNAWTKTSGKTAGQFESNANETLRRNPDIKAAVIDLLALVKSSRQKNPSIKEGSVARAKEQVRLHKTIREIAEAEMLKARAEIRALRDENEALRAQARSIAEEAIRIKEQLDSELADERRKVAELLSAKSREIRVVK